MSENKTWAKMIYQSFNNDTKETNFSRYISNHAASKQTASPRISENLLTVVGISPRNSFTTFSCFYYHPTNCFISSRGEFRNQSNI